MSTKKAHARSGRRNRKQGASILRQLTGAVVGGGLALGIYYIYEYGAPVVTAWLTVPQDQFTVEAGVAAQKDLKETEQRRIAKRARYIVNKYGQEVAAPPPKKGVPANWDLEAIENLEQAADEGWGGWTDEWPEPPEVPQDEEASEDWDTAWDDTWNDDFEALEALSYNAEEDVKAENWDETWDDSYGEEEVLAADAPAEASPANRAAPSSPSSISASQEGREVVAHTSNAPALPSSGVGLWLAVLLPLAGTVGLQRRRILRLCGNGECDVA